MVPFDNFIEGELKWKCLVHSVFRKKNNRTGESMIWNVTTMAEIL